MTQAGSRPVIFSQICRRVQAKKEPAAARAVGDAQKKRKDRRSASTVPPSKYARDVSAQPAHQPMQRQRTRGGLTLRRGFRSVVARWRHFVNTESRERRFVLFEVLIS